MTNQKKPISVKDLPESGDATVAPDDFQPAVEEVKGGGRFSVRAGVRRNSIRRMSSPSLRVGKRLLDADSANTWRSR